MGRQHDTPGPNRAAFERHGYLFPIHLEPAAIAAHDEAMRPFAAAIHGGAEKEGRTSASWG